MKFKSLSLINVGVEKVFALGKSPVQRLFVLWKIKALSDLIASDRREDAKEQ